MCFFFLFFCVPEPGHRPTQPGGVGHAGETVLQRHRDQGVGHCLLCPAETMPRGGAQVRGDDILYVFIYADGPDNMSKELERDRYGDMERGGSRKGGRRERRERNRAEEREE